MKQSQVFGEQELTALRREMAALRRNYGSTEPTVAADSGGEENTT